MRRSLVGSEKCIRERFVPSEGPTTVIRIHAQTDRAVESIVGFNVSFMLAFPSPLRTTHIYQLLYLISHMFFLV